MRRAPFRKRKREELPFHIEHKLVHGELVPVKVYEHLDNPRPVPPETGKPDPMAIRHRRHTSRTARNHGPYADCP